MSYAEPGEGPRVQPQQGQGGFRQDPRIAHAVHPAATRTCCCAPHGGHSTLRQDAAAAAELGDRNQVRGRHNCAVVPSRRRAPVARHAEPEIQIWPPRSSWTHATRLAGRLSSLKLVVLRAPTYRWRSKNNLGPGTGCEG